MEKVFGATERHDTLIVLSTKRAVLIFGYGEEDGQGYDYRHTFLHVPTKQEIVEVITSHINELTDKRILEDFVWNGKNVWLSAENQRNFSEAQRAAMIMPDKALPVKFKLGEDAGGKPVYHTFESVEELTGFYLNAVAYVQQCINEGWQQKDAATEWVQTLDVE